MLPSWNLTPVTSLFYSLLVRGVLIVHEGNKAKKETSIKKNNFSDSELS